MTDGHSKSAFALRTRYLGAPCNTLALLFKTKIKALLNETTTSVRKRVLSKSPQTASEVFGAHRFVDSTKQKNAVKNDGVISLLRLCIGVEHGEVHKRARIAPLLPSFQHLCSNQVCSNRELLVCRLTPRSTYLCNKTLNKRLRKGLDLRSARTSCWWFLGARRTRLG
jgi:hypothetical protein